MKHTKGPWNLDGGTNEKGDLFVWKSGEYYGGHAIATVHGEIEEGAEANARLIVAAPETAEQRDDLLSVVKNALVSLAIINMPTMGDPGDVATNDELVKVMAESFKAAIARAEKGA